eukprot:1182878-Prorocentrum_minimum.AAC.1
MAEENAAEPPKAAEPPATQEGAPASPGMEKPGSKDPKFRAKLIIKEFQEARDRNAEIAKKLEAARERRMQRNKQSVENFTSSITLLSTQPNDKKAWKATWSLSNPQEVSGAAMQQARMAKEALEKEKDMFQKELEKRKAADEQRMKKREEEAIAFKKRQEQRKKHEALVSAKVMEQRQKVVTRILEKKAKREESSAKVVEEVLNKRNAKLEAMHNTEATRYTSVVTKLLAGEEAEKQKILAKFEVNRAKRNVDILKEKFFPAMYERLALEHAKDEAYRQKLIVMEEEEKQKREVAFQKTLNKGEHASQNRSAKVEQIQKKVTTTYKSRVQKVDVALEKKVEEHAKKMAEIESKEMRRIEKLKLAKQKQMEHHIEVLAKQKEVVVFRDLVEDLAIRTANDKKVAEIIPDRPVVE